MIWVIIGNILASPPQHKLVHNLCCTLVSLLPSNCSSLPRKYYHLFLSRMWWEFHHLLIILDIIILLAIFVHSLVPVLFTTRIPTMELWRVNSKLLATLLLWSEWAIVHSKSFANWITILTLVVQPNPYFGRTFQPMFNCVCFPRAYIIIPFKLTNVIFLFTLSWKSIRLESSMNCRWAHQPPSHPLLGLRMNYCFKNPLP